MTITIDQFQARNADLAKLVDVLKFANDCKLDAIVPATAITSRYGTYHIEGMSTTVQADTVDAALSGEQTRAVGQFVPTSACDGQIANTLKVPVEFHRRMRETRLDIYDEVVNALLHGHQSQAGRHFAGDGYADADPDGRNFMIRTYIDPDGGPGLMRAMLSDRFNRIDNLDVLLAVLQAIKDAGIEIVIPRANLTEQRMSVHVIMPSLTEAAPELLAGYRSPVRGWDFESLQKTFGPDHLGWGQGQATETPPLVFAGFEITCGETGGSRFSLWPRIEWMICKNGWVIEADALHRVHLGGKLEAGQINWSDETHRKNMELVASQTRDAVATFANVDYVKGILRQVTEKATKPVDDPQATVTLLSKELGWDETTEKLILNHFILGGQMTAGGFAQAMTSAAQVVDSADVAYDLEHQVMRGLELAAK